ncbi:histidine kinase [Saliniramus sp.]|uniref:histidine kinase n=1 Tax=Saliniramus sp. TaxID=2986772 RepID=UPI002CCD6298|nr:histidine kinase [Saliniramus sp.]HMB11457.1 histidine kinase [Saliniramus sp.]
MADYHPLIARAVQGLPDPAPEMRAAVYDRARTALFAQLRSLDPPLSEEEFEAERHALESAIAGVESEYAGPAPDDEAGAQDDNAVAADLAGHPMHDQAMADDTLPDESPPDRAPLGQTGLAYPGQASAQGSASASDGRHSGQTYPPYATDDPASPEDSPLPPRVPQPEAAEGSTAAQTTPVPPPPAAKARPRLDGRSQRASSGGSLRAVIVALSLIVVIGAIAFAAYWLSREDEAPVAGVTPPDIQAPAPIEQPPRIEDRLMPDETDADEIAPERVSPEPPAALPDDEVGVAQRAMLYEEDPANPTGEPRAAAGSALWRLDTNDPDDPAIIVQVRVPDMGITMTMTIRRNLDPDLPASHTIELDFVNTGDEDRNVLDAGLPHLKEDEVVRGAPLAGLTVPISDNFFLIGLSNLRADQQRNRNLLIDRNWIELPMRFAGGQRAVIAFDKGMSGQQVIEQAFAAWEE